MRLTIHDIPPETTATDRSSNQNVPRLPTAAPGLLATDGDTIFITEAREVAMTPEGSLTLTRIEDGRAQSVTVPFEAFYPYNSTDSKLVFHAFRAVGGDSFWPVSTRVATRDGLILSGSSIRSVSQGRSST